MKKYSVWVVGMIFLGLGAMVAQAAPPYQVGEKWVYKQNGPRPWGPPDSAVTGDRVREVVSTEGSGADQRWLVKETWGGDDNNPSQFYFDEKKAVNKLVVGERMVIQYVPPMPFDFSSLKPGEEKTTEIQSKVGDAGDSNGFPVKVIAKRLPDATVKVPAGEFTDCVHVEMQTIITFKNDQGEVKISMKQEIFTHSKVNGAVKETFTFEPTKFGDQERKGYTSTSELKEYTAQKK